MFPRRAGQLLIPIAGLLVLVTLAPTRTSSRQPAPPAEPTRPLAPVSSLATPPDTALLGSWTFDGPMGVADAQGWTTVDLTPQPVYFHVDDFAGLVSPLAPLQGTQSLWCGLRAGPATCTWAAPPGYGNDWHQALTSIPFAVTGDVTVECEIYHDTEPSYEGTFLQYLTKSNVWRTLAWFWEGAPPPGHMEYAHYVIPEDSLTGSARIRFYFFSDGAWSDEDGLHVGNGTLIDSLTVSDMNGVVDYQDFEAEAVGATATADGHWAATGIPPFGDFAALLDGSTVLQEDTLTVNTTHLWGFFNGSPATYACGGHPEQAAIPPPYLLYDSEGSFPQWIAGINNAVCSPVTSLVEDVNGQPVPWAAQTLLLSFDLYTDISGTCLYENGFIKAEFLVDGCWKSRYFGGFAWDPQQTSLGWARGTGLITGIPDAASYVRVRLGVRESTACDCRSHWPLFDNIELSAITEFTVGATPTPTTAHLEQNIPNPFNPATTIRYTLSSPGPVSLRVYDVSGRLVRTLVDAVQKSGDGAMAIEWDGRDDAGSPVASGIYLYRLVAPGIDETRKAVLLK